MTVRERPLYSYIALEHSIDGGANWTSLLGSASVVSVRRGGSRTAVGQTVDVGTMSVTLVNEGDPLAGGTIVPNQKIRLVEVLSMADPALYASDSLFPSDDLFAAAPTVYGSALFTGNVVDVNATYDMDLQTGKLTTFVTITASDAVQVHQATQRFGAVTADGSGSETWAARIRRLASSSLADIDIPDESSILTIYSLG